MFRIEPYRSHASAAVSARRVRAAASVAPVAPKPIPREPAARREHEELWLEMEAPDSAPASTLGSLGTIAGSIPHIPRAAALAAARYQYEAQRSDRLSTYAPGKLFSIEA